MKKEILILCKTNLQRDPRVLKQIEALHQDYNLTCVGTVKSMHTGVQNDLDLFHTFFLRLLNVWVLLNCDRNRSFLNKKKAF